jgi:polysaccharide chain length determinant protein (PEP-CTERM system associated)
MSAQKVIRFQGGEAMPQDSDINVMLNRIRTVVIRRRWWLISCFFLVSLGAVVFSFVIPEHYRSEATIFIERPRVPERYIVPNNTVNAMQAIQARTHEVLSRTSLLQMINDFQLYPHGKRGVETEAMIAAMRENIEVQPLTKDAERREVNAFVIAFTGNDPYVAQKVTQRLIDVFIEQNLRTQQEHDVETTKFLENELEAAGENLQKQEQLLRDFKMKNLGQLPEQQQGNLQILSGLQMDLQNAEASLARAKEQRIYLESMLSQYVAPGTTTATGSQTYAANPIEALQAELTRLRSERNDLLSRYSSRYPDVVGLTRRIAEDETQLSRLVAASRSSSGKDTENGSDKDELGMEPGQIQFRSQYKANTVEIANIEKNIEHIKSELTDYQQRLGMAPVREQQLAEVVRNYDLSKQNYADLLNKKTQSKLATDLSKQQQDEQFRVIDPPSLPLKPSSPNRPKICLIGLVMGLLAGVGLAFLVEMRDRSFRLEKDVREDLGIPLVVGIPSLFTEKEKGVFAWRRRVEWASGCALVCIVLAAQVYVHWKS